MKMGNASSADSLTIEASHATGHGDHRLDRLIDRLPDRLRTTVRWLRRPGARRRIRLFTGARLLDVSARAGLACRRRAAADCGAVAGSRLDRTPPSRMAHTEL